MGRRRTIPVGEHNELDEFRRALESLARAISRVRRFFRSDNDELMAYYPAIAEYALAMDSRFPPPARSPTQVLAEDTDLAAAGTPAGAMPDSTGNSEQALGLSAVDKEPVPLGCQEEPGPAPWGMPAEERGPD